MSNCLQKTKLLCCERSSGPLLMATIENIVDIRSGMVYCGRAARNALRTQSTEQRKIAFTTEADEL
jgi:hypothetical protein